MQKSFLYFSCLLDSEKFPSGKRLRDRRKGQGMIESLSALKCDSSWFEHKGHRLALEIQYFLGETLIGKQEICTVLVWKFLT